MVNKYEPATVLVLYACRTGTELQLAVHKMGRSGIACLLFTVKDTVIITVGNISQGFISKMIASFLLVVTCVVVKKILYNIKPTPCHMQWLHEIQLHRVASYLTLIVISFATSV